MTKTLGLKRGTVSLAPYNPKWVDLYKREEKELKTILGGKVYVEHIGSTAIPGISAKPLVDVMVGIPLMRDIKKYIQKLEASGYHYRPNFGRIDQHVVLAKGNEHSRTHYIHVLRYNGKLWKDRLVFRDYLRTHPSLVKQYASLKERLAKQFANDRAMYTDRKGEFIRNVVKKAQGESTKKASWLE